MKNKNNKKGQALYQELIIAVVAVVFISILLFLATKYVTKTEKDITNLNPEITYQFPAVYTHTFLMQEIKKKDKKSLNLNENEKIFVKDLIKLETQESKDLINKYKESYILETLKLQGNKNSIDYFNEFSNSKIQKGDLLKIEYDIEYIPSLQDQLEDKNYYFYIQNKNKKYTIIYFKNKIIKTRMDEINQLEESGP